MATRRTTRAHANRRQPTANNPATAPPVQLLTAVKAVAVCTLTFDQQVMLKGTPTILTNGVVPKHCISAVQTAPDTIEATFSGTIASSNSSIILTPFDPTMRGVGGGFVSATRFPVT